MTDLIDLASEQVGGAVLAVNDEFFAPAANLVKATTPEWREDVFTDRGKWMDGWESRRRRSPGHDWCVIRLGIAGEVKRVVVDTTHFRGNYPEACSVEACGVGFDDALPGAMWEELLPRSELKGDAVNGFDVEGGRRVTHLRFNIFPDGGVARLRVLGVPLPALQEVAPEGALPDLAGAVLGGSVTEASDDFFGSADALLRPGPSSGMFDGWETRRRRGEGNDWVKVLLGLRGTPRHVVVDTSHFKGNAPGSVAVEASADGERWIPIVGRRGVGANRQHLFEAESDVEAALVRLDIFPDGGVARFRVYGDPTASAREQVRVRYLNALFEEEAHRFFGTACGSLRWVERMAAGQPYASGAAVLEAANAAFDMLGESDWEMAFAAHPRIGERVEGIPGREQAVAVSTATGREKELAEGNTRYEERFGRSFIIAAQGKTTDEVIEAMEQRMNNEPKAERLAAAAEQRVITERRLRHMLCLGPAPT
ncbi:MAG TPA: allantoicase [Acidimicrobiia bacterium]|nr:allantoicase [Acidimicrobiia bacterium]